MVNAEEGEPGLFKDRHIIEGDPHLLLEGMLTAAYAAGTSIGYIYVNAEANLSADRLEEAIQQAPAATSAAKRPPSLTPSRATGASPGSVLPFPPSRACLPNPP